MPLNICTMNCPSASLGQFYFLKDVVIKFENNINIKPKKEVEEEGATGNGIEPLIVCTLAILLVCVCIIIKAMFEVD